jgi:hypothetical protein
MPQWISATEKFEKAINDINADLLATDKAALTCATVLSEYAQGLYERLRNHGLDPAQRDSCLDGLEYTQREMLLVESM